MSGEIVQIVFVWPDGREEVRYERPVNSEDGRKMMAEVEEIRARCSVLNEECPYFFRFV